MKSFYKLISLGLFTILFSLNTQGSSTDSLIKRNAQWKYLANGSNQGTSWRNTSFNDASWPTGTAEFGYGDGDEATVISYGNNAGNKYITSYFRKSITISSTGAYTGMTLGILRDDGAVVYVNGTERCRTNMPTGNIGFKTTASTAITGTAETTYNTVTLLPSYFANGTNVIAVEIHQFSKSDPDVSFNLFLTADIAPCGVPSSVTTSNITSNSAQVSWTAATGGPGSYDVQYREVGALTWSAPINTASTSTTLTGLNYNTNYEVQVRTNCITGNQSAYSASATFTTAFPSCTIPSNRQTTNITTSDAKVSWDALADAASYDVQYRVTGAPTWNAAINTTNASLTLSGLAYNTTYEWQVRTNCIYGNQSSYSTSATFTTLTPACDVPQNETSSNITTSSADVSWDAVSAAASYDVQYRVVGAPTWSSPLNTASTTLSLTGLNYNSNYEWQVRTNCIYGNQSAYSASANFLTQTPPCDIPAGENTSSVTSSSAIVSWNAVTGAGSYDVQYRVVGAPTWSGPVNTTSTSLTLSNLIYSTDYEWQVRTNCTYGNQSAYSSSTNFTTAVPSCDIPAGLTTTNVTESSAKAVWNAVTGASSYDVQYRVIGAPTWNPSTNTTSTTLTLSSLNYSTNYEWQVRTNCIYGNQSNYSASVNFTTLTPVCNVPSGMATANITTTSAKISWNAVTGASSYDVQYRVVGAPTWSAAINTVNTNLTLSSLSPGTNYEWQVRTNCIYGNQSAYSSSTLFTTLIPCGDVTAVTIGTVTTTTAVVSWSAVTSATNYTIQYRPIAAASWSSVTTASLSTTLSGLSTGKTYEVQVSATCPSGQGNFSMSVSFTTPLATSITVRSAYLQVVTPTSFRVRWRTSTATNSQVRYGFTMSYGNVVTDPTSTTEHEVLISGLSANKQYYYTIGSTTQDLQGDANVYCYTALAAGDPSPFRVWATGDFGNNSAGQTATRDAMNTYCAGNLPHLWVWMGDNAYNAGLDAEFTSNVFNIYPNQMRNIPIYPCLGNHDYANVGYQSASALGTGFPYFSMFTCPTAAEGGGLASGTEKYYSYNYGNAHFIVLDSYGALNTSGSAMYTWLNNDLAANSQKFTIVMWHHPPYSHGTHNSDTETEMVNMRTNIVPLLDQYKVDLVLNGHSHTYERTWLIKGHYGVASTFNSSMTIDGSNGLSPYYLKSSSTTLSGTVYCVCGVSGQGGSVSTLGTWPYTCMSNYSRANYGSMIIDFSGDTLDAKFLTSTGTIYDRFKIVKPAARPAMLITDTEKSTLEAFPNPFTNELNIRFGLDKESAVRIEVYDVLGKEIYSSANKSAGILQPGVYDIGLGETELGESYGMLIIKLTANGKVMQTLINRVK